MTNEEKAKAHTAELIKANPDAKRWNSTTTYMSACEWKDAQFKEYLDKKHEEFTIKGTWENSYDWGRRSAIEEIINELFGGE